MRLKQTGGIGNQSKNRDPPDNSIVEIGKTTQKISGDLGRLACHSDFWGGPLADLDLKNSQGVK